MTAPLKPLDPNLKMLKTILERVRDRYQAETGLCIACDRPLQGGVCRPCIDESRAIRKTGLLQVQATALMTEEYTDKDVCYLCRKPWPREKGRKCQECMDKIAAYLAAEQAAKQP